MKKVLIGIAAVLFITPAFAFFGNGFTIDGVATDSAVNKSRTVKMTIRKCGTGRMRSVNNAAAKCNVKAKRMGIQRRSRSAILQRDKARFRGSNVSSSYMKPVVKESLGEKVKRILAAKRASKKN